MTQTANPRLLVLCIVSSPIKTCAGYYQGVNDRVNRDVQELSCSKKRDAMSIPSITNV